MSQPETKTLHPLIVTSFTLDYSCQGDPLQIVAKRFSYPEPNGALASRGEFTLLLTSGIGSSTEVWIPTIKRLYQLQAKSQSTLRIGHVWTVDSTNQGDSAVLNDQVLKEKYSDHTQVLANYALSVRRVLYSGLVDYKGTKLVAIGHSAGCGALIHAIPETVNIPYHSLILLEPSLYHRKVINALEEAARRNRPLLLKRPDIWSSKEDAINWMKKRRPWQTWHPEVLQAVSDFGLRALPTAEHPDKTGVTTKQYKGQEAVSFFSTEDNCKSVELMVRFCSSIPVHTVWGEQEDFFPKKFQSILTDPKQGRRMTSITEIPGAGHWVLHEKPDEVSKLIFKMLGEPKSTRFKL